MAAAAEAEIDLRRRAGGTDQSGDRPGAHQLRDGDRRDRAAVVDRSQPAEHPDPHRGRQPHPPRLHRRAGASCWSAPTTRRSSCGCSPMSPTSRRCAKVSRAARTSTPAPPAKCSACRWQGMDPMTRRRAKAINFGIIYGISALRPGAPARHRRRARRAATSTPISRATRASAPTWNDTKEAARGQRLRHHPVRPALLGARHRATRTPARRGYAERQAINAPLQGGAADIIKRAMVRLPRGAARSPACARGCCCRCTTNCCSRRRRPRPAPLAALAKRVMEAAASLSVPLVVETGQGATWAEAH